MSSLNDPPPGFLSLRQAADWANVSPRTLRRLMGKGLPYYQVSPRSKVLLRPLDLEVFFTKRQATPPNLDALVRSVSESLTHSSARRM